MLLRTVLFLAGCTLISGLNWRFWKPKAIEASKWTMSRQLGSPRIKLDDLGISDDEDQTNRPDGRPVRYTHEDDSNKLDKPQL